MGKPNNKTVQDILLADDIRSVLFDVNEHIDDLETIVVVTRDRAGHLRCRYYASAPEVLGLLVMAKMVMENTTMLDIGEEDG